jgi:hypothetical protein
MSTSCSGGGIFNPGHNVDGVYRGDIGLNRQFAGFDNHVYTDIRIYDNGHRARLWDERGEYLEAYDVDFGSYNNRARIYFRVVEEKWTLFCGREIYRWDFILDGNFEGSRFRGDVRLDIDPYQYSSTFCSMDYDPAPEYLGYFNFSLNDDYYPAW